MNTQSRPSRSSTVSAVRTGDAGARRTATRDGGQACATGVSAATIDASPRPQRRQRDGARVGQRSALGEWIGRHQMRIVDRGDMGQRVQRQPEADRRIAGHRNSRPRRVRHSSLSQPGLRLRGPALHRQHEARGLRQLAVEQRAGCGRAPADRRSSDRSGSTFSGSAPSLSMRSAGSSNTGCT